jgi:hypothetical protein
VVQWTRKAVSAVPERILPAQRRVLTNVKKTHEQPDELQPLFPSSACLGCVGEKKSGQLLTIGMEEPALVQVIINLRRRGTA